MSTSFVLTSKTRFDTFKDNVSLGDGVQYEIDCRPWQEDNAVITTVEWTVESGQASISNETNTGGILSALVSFPSSGKTLISILASTASGKAKKMWLEVRAKDKQIPSDDYGLSDD